MAVKNLYTERVKLMLRHIVMWRYMESFTDRENAENAARIKRELEALPAVIDGCLDMKVTVNVLPSSNMDIMLDSLFDDVTALDRYMEHPEHKKAAAFITATTCDRVCVDYIV
jgi:hypothetical protein